MTATRLAARVLHPGAAAAEALVLEESLSFWGGFDAATGVIVDRHHPQRGARVAGRVLVLPESRGSAGTPAGIAEALRRGVGPAGVVLGRADVNVAVGAMIAAALYGVDMPVVVMDDPDRAGVRSGDRIAIDRDGRLTVERR